MITLAYSGIELTSKEGLETLLRYAKGNSMMDKPAREVIFDLIMIEDDIATEIESDYQETLRDAMPNPWD